VHRGRLPRGHRPHSAHCSASGWWRPSAEPNSSLARRALTQSLTIGREIPSSGAAAACEQPPSTSSSACSPSSFECRGVLPRRRASRRASFASAGSGGRPVGPPVQPIRVRCPRPYGRVNFVAPPSKEGSLHLHKSAWIGATVGWTKSHVSFEQGNPRTAWAGLLAERRLATTDLPGFDDVRAGA
jgi:hypothetical protein